MAAISKNLFRRFYSFPFRQAIGSQTNGSYLLTRFDSRFDSKHRRYCSQKKWITIILEKKDGTRIKRKGEIGETLFKVLNKDPDFPGYGECDGTKICSTCHVIFTKEDFSTVRKYNIETEKEEDVLDEIATRFALTDWADFATDTSRLGCCITLTPEMDGMVIQLPKSKSILD